LKKEAHSYFKNLYKAPHTEDLLNQIKVIKELPGFFSESESEDIWKEVLLEELKEVVTKMPKDKSPGPGGRTQELFSFFFDIMGPELLKVVEESRVSGKVDGAINFTFITLIPKESFPSSLSDFRPISLSNFIHRVSSKVIASRIKDKLSSCISSEQFGFLQDRLISDAIGLVQECIHTAKVRKKVAMFLKLDLKKAYDRVSWNFLKLVLIQIGLKWEILQWILGCACNANFAILINEPPT
jgi:hypothetical protein